MAAAPVKSLALPLLTKLHLVKHGVNIVFMIDPTGLVNKGFDALSEAVGLTDSPSDKTAAASNAMLDCKKRLMKEAGSLISTSSKFATIVGQAAKAKKILDTAQKDKAAEKKLYAELGGLESQAESKARTLGRATATLESKYREASAVIDKLNTSCDKNQNRVETF